MIGNNTIANKITIAAPVVVDTDPEIGELVINSNGSLTVSGGKTLKINNRLIINSDANNNSGKYSERYESVMLGQDDTANIQIVRYILQFNENDYLSLCAYTELLVAETIDSMKAQDASDRQKIVGNIKNITAELRAIEERMLGQDNYKKMRDALYASIDKNRLQLRPEQVAKVLTEKKLPFELDKNNNLKPLDEDVLSFA